MKQLFFISLITVLTLSSCESSTPTTKEVETNDPVKKESTITLKPEPVVDKVNQDTTEVAKKVTEKIDTTVKKQEGQAEDNSVNIEDALDVNKYKSVRDDPDYIGTPCEYVNGECIRHDHKRQEELPDDLDEK